MSIACAMLIRVENFGASPLHLRADADSRGEIGLSDVAGIILLHQPRRVGDEVWIALGLAAQR